MAVILLQERVFRYKLFFEISFCMFFPPVFACKAAGAGSAYVCLNATEHRGRFSVLTYDCDDAKIEWGEGNAENTKEKEQHRDLSCRIPWNQ